jgi:hypothetical protein
MSDFEAIIAANWTIAELADLNDLAGIEPEPCAFGLTAAELADLVAAGVITQAEMDAALPR